MAPSRAAKKATRSPGKPGGGKSASASRMGGDPFTPSSPPPIPKPPPIVEARPAPTVAPAPSPPPPPIAPPSTPEPEFSGPPPFPDDPPAPPPRASPPAAAIRDPLPPPIDDGISQYSERVQDPPKPPPSAAPSSPTGDPTAPSGDEASPDGDEEKGRSAKEDGDIIKGAVAIIERLIVGLDDMALRDVMPEEKLQRWLDRQKFDPDEKALLVKVLRPFAAKHPELFDSNNVLIGTLIATVGLRLADTAMMVKKYHFPPEPEEPQAARPPPRPHGAPRSNGPTVGPNAPNSAARQTVSVQFMKDAPPNAPQTAAGPKA